MWQTIQHNGLAFMIFGGRMISSIYKFKAAFFDIDLMGVMWHGHYVKYLEMARCSLLDEIKYNYMDMKNDGFALPIIKMDLKYIAPLTFNEDFSVKITLKECDTLLKFNYIFMQNENIIARATTTQAVVKMDTLETQFAMPQGLIDAINLINKGK